METKLVTGLRVSADFIYNAAISRIMDGKPYDQRTPKHFDEADKQIEKWPAVQGIRMALEVVPEMVALLERNQNVIMDALTSGHGITPAIADDMRAVLAEARTLLAKIKKGE